MSSRFRLFIDLITDKARTELRDFQNEVDSVGEDWQRVKVMVQRESREILGLINGLVGLAQNVSTQFGDLLGPFGEYLLGLISVTIATLTNMAIAASSTIIAAPLGITIAAAAGLFSIAAHGAAAQGLAELRTDVDNMAATVSSIGTVVSSLSGLI